MTDSNVKLAPGCYGLGMIYRAEAPECAVCPFAGTCAPLATQRLTALRLKFGVKEAKPRTPRPMVSPAPGAKTAAMTMPKKVETLMEKIERAGIKITEAFRKGENPFPNRLAFLKVTAHLLLRLPSGVQRQTLEHAFMTKLNWGAGTANAHAAQAFQLLTAVGAAVESNGILHLRKQ